MPRVLSLHSGVSEALRNAPTKRSAIRKVALSGPVRIEKYGIIGDEQVDQRYHGGPFKALCAYASEYYPQWRELTGENMPLGSFGENLALEGVMDPDVCLGDVWSLGGATVQVTGPRGPCKTLATHWNSTTVHLETKRQRRTGFYLRVLEPGVAEAGAEFELLERQAPRWTLPAFWDLFDHGGEAADFADILRLDALDDDWRIKAKKKV